MGRAAAAQGWDYASVLPYFLTAENQARGTRANTTVSEVRGLSVEDLKYRNPLSTVFVEAGVECGLPHNADFNGPTQDGVGFSTRSRSAMGAAAARQLPICGPLQQRKNLEILTHSLVTRVAFQGTRAQGVEYRSRGAVRFARAEREVLLAAGAIGSPLTLLRSGIGPADELGALGIPIVANRAEVGRNLQDHLDYCTVTKCRGVMTYDFNAWQELLTALRYMLTHSGPGVSNIAEAGGFARTHLAPDARPDIQLHFVPAQLDNHGRNRLRGNGFTIHSCALRPLSRGHLSLRSSRAEDPPRIHASYLSEKRDVEVMVEGILLARAISQSAAFAPFRGAEIFPGDGVTTREGVELALRRKAETIYHPVGSCRMGSDPASVVDCELQVRGVEGLRVIDASVMPKLIGGNTNAPTIMIAEKAADQLLSRCGSMHSVTGRSSEVG